MKHTIDQQLIAANSDSNHANEKFVARTMQAVAKVGTAETFNNLVPKDSVIKKETLRMKVHNLRLRFNSLPRAVAIAIIIGSTGTVGAAAYATYRWIVPKVTITNVQQNNDDNKKQYTVNSQCGDFRSGKALQYEISKSSSLTDQEAYKVFQNTCAYDALATFMGTRWPSDDGANKKVGDVITQYNYLNTFAGSTAANPIFGLTIGKVTAISPTTVTFSTLLYSVDNSAHADPSKPYRDYYPNGKEFSRTLMLAPNVEVWANGQQIKLADVKPGDTIQVVTRTQNKIQYYEDIKQNALGEQITFDVAGIIKTDIDTKYVADDAAQIGDPKIVNALAGIGPCDGNPQYSCVSVSNQAFGIVYGHDDSPAQDKLNKYLRKDITDDKKVKYFRLHGRVTAINGTHVTLETRGKKASFTVDLPYDAIAEYNQPKPVVTDLDRSRALGVTTGDLIEVVYGQTTEENHLAIKPGDLELFAVIEQTQPDGSLAKY